MVSYHHPEFCYTKEGCIHLTCWSFLHNIHSIEHSLDENNSCFVIYHVHDHQVLNFAACVNEFFKDAEIEITRCNSSKDPIHKDCRAVLDSKSNDETLVCYVVLLSGFLSQIDCFNCSSPAIWMTTGIELKCYVLLKFTFFPFFLCHSIQLGWNGWIGKMVMMMMMMMILKWLGIICKLGAKAL